uniref:Putative secreted protein n=1 Tax=Anopheles darlingi TaxID=43151 RepID=A0A2M4DEB2_ANODA
MGNITIRWGFIYAVHCRAMSVVEMGYAEKYDSVIDDRAAPACQQVDNCTTEFLDMTLTRGIAKDHHYRCIDYRAQGIEQGFWR